MEETDKMDAGNNDTDNPQRSQPSIMTKLKHAAKFLLFIEDNPKRGCVKALNVWSAIAMSYFCFIIPACTFLALMPLGFAPMLLGEVLIGTATIEGFHILLDS